MENSWIGNKILPLILKPHVAAWGFLYKLLKTVYHILFMKCPLHKEVDCANGLYAD